MNATRWIDAPIAAPSPTDQIKCDKFMLMLQQKKLEKHKSRLTGYRQERQHSTYQCKIQLACSPLLQVQQIQPFRW